MGTTTLQDQLKTTMSTPLIKSTDGSSLVTVGTLVLLALGALALYFFVPERAKNEIKKSFS